jgi:acetyl-CoA acetyltransferase
MAYTGITNAVIVGAVRTPIGKHGGALSAVRPDDLAALALDALMERTGVPPSEIEDVYMGCANQAGVLGGAHPDHARARDEAQGRCAVRSRHDVHRGGAGHRHDRRAD